MSHRRATPMNFGWDPQYGRCEPWCDKPCSTLRSPLKDCAGCTGAYACQLTAWALPNKSFATFGKWTRGYCTDWTQKRASRRFGAGNCSTGDRGNWQWSQSPTSGSGSSDFWQWCVQQCAGCERCAAVSASLRRQDCLWHSACRRPLVAPPLTAPLSRVYRTFRVRTDRGHNPRSAPKAEPCTVASLAGPPPAPGQVAMTSSCTREELVPWYLRHEKRCVPWPPGRGVDLYQFGVPSSMLPISKEMADRKMLPLYHTYWGFDSFVGLPEETAGALRPSAHTWGVGQFSYSHAQFASNVTHDANGAEVYAMGERAGQPLPSPDSVRLALQGRAFKPEHRARLVAGFYNDSLTPSLAAQARPAAYAEFDCDLHISTAQALRWMLTHELLVPGSLVGYDDWFEAPFLRGGESSAHLELTREFLVEWELLSPDPASARVGKGCRQLTFRVLSIGVVADAGIDAQLADKSCHATPLRVTSTDGPRVPPADCLRYAEAQRELWRSRR